MKAGSGEREKSYGFLNVRGGKEYPECAGKTGGQATLGVGKDSCLQAAYAFSLGIDPLADLSNPAENRLKNKNRL